MDYNTMPEGKTSAMKALWMELKLFIKESRRVLTITKKPTSEEFQTITKVSGLGLLAIGLIGFLVITIAQYIK